MIAYGVCVRSQQRFDTQCLPGIVNHGGPDAALLTSTDAPLAAGYNEIIDAARAIEGLEALVLLDEGLEITDAQFTDKVSAAVTSGADIAGVVGANGGATLDFWSWPELHGGLRTLHGEIRHDTGVTIVDAVDGICLILSPRAVSTLHFDAARFPGEHGLDVDLCFRAREAGLQVAVVDLAVLMHGEGAVDRGQDYAAAAAQFQAKWAEKISDRVSRCDSSMGDSGVVLAPGGRAAGTKSESDAPANYYGFERPELTGLVPSSARRVLDVGCAAGALGAALKRRLPHCEVSGVEYVQSVVEQAGTRLDHAVQADLNATIDLPFPAGYFDAMIFGDVLEHLLDPEHSLRRLLPYLADDGVVIASIPNVKHWSVMIPALAHDRWEYTDEGLLDRTHVHLFTLSEAMRMFRAVGLDEHVSAGANVIPLEPADRLDPLVSAACAYGADSDEVRRLLNCYQYLLVVKRPRQYVAGSM